MTDEELKEEQDLARARQVQQLLEDPIIVQAFADVRDRLTQQMINAPMGDPSLIVGSHAQLQALTQVEQQLQRAMETGKLILEKEEQRLEMESFLDEDPVE